ncbi:hypothetical protein TNCV_2760681 [Trichonephila clavipes]|nr:hypothetical protein TNCV_2760681 [Trichonephila clavipes]
MATTITRFPIVALFFPLEPSQGIDVGDVVTAQMDPVARLHAASTFVDTTLLCQLYTDPIHCVIKPASMWHDLTQEVMGDLTDTSLRRVSVLILTKDEFTT